jgi:hypothetical protein
MIFSGPRIGFYQGKKLFWELEQWTTGDSTKRMRNLYPAFDKANSQRNKYSSAA